MADTVQIAGGLKARLPRLPDRGLGYCTDSGELYIGTPTGNVLLNAPTDAQALVKLQGDMEAALGRVKALESGLAALQGRVTALESAASAAEQAPA